MCLWFASLAKCTASGDDIRSIRMVFGEGYPPYYHSNAKGGAFGLVLDQFLASHPRFDIDRVMASRKRLDALVASNEAQAFSLSSPMFVPDQYRRTVKFTRPIWCTYDRLLSLQQSPVEFSHYADLAGKTIGTFYGSGYGPLDVHFNSDTIYQVSSYDHAGLLKLLFTGRIDAMVVNEQGIGLDLQQRGLDPQDFHLSSQALYGIPLATMVHVDAVTFYQAFDRFIAEIQSNGWLAEINRQFHLKSAEPSIAECEPTVLGQIQP